MKWSLTIFQTGWEPHQRVTQPAEKWERPLGACGFALTLSSDCTFKSTNCIVTPFLLLRSFYSYSFTLKIHEEPHYLLSLTLHLFSPFTAATKHWRCHTPPHSSVPHTWPSASQPSAKSSVIPEVQFKLCLSIQVSLAHNLYFLYSPNKISAKEVILPYALWASWAPLLEHLSHILIVYISASFLGLDFQVLWDKMMSLIPISPVPGRELDTKCSVNIWWLNKHIDTRICILLIIVENFM